MFTLQPRHRLDIGLRHFAYALFAGAWARSPERLSARLEAGWSPGSHGLACLSVRSGFHLLLESLALPPGSEVLVSAVTHPDMVRILEAHALVPVPVDLDVATLSPRLDLAERFVTPRTAAILVAHLFGGRVAMSPLADFAKRHRLMLWEDCAQAFAGPGETADQIADVSMYSFGALKTCTALGGALLKVMDPSLLARMRAAQCLWRLQSRSTYARTVLKFAVFTLITRPFPYGLLATAHHALRRDFDRTINSSVKALRPGPLLPQLEVRPSAPLLATLAHRLYTFDEARLRRRAAAGEWLSGGLPDNLPLAGHRMESRTHWLFPVLSREPDQLILACRRAGMDGARGASSVIAVPAPADRAEADPAAARQMMADLVFLPAYPELSRRSAVRLVEAIGGAGVELPVTGRARRVLQS
ncbi:MAG TPA: DegT/DnrJ/EryC1/StrS family aminotransferase [Candidatus Dormibacteraeota bacterium]